VDTRHRVVEAFMFDLKTKANQEPTYWLPLYDHAVSTANVLAHRCAWYVDKGSPEITDLASLLELRGKFVEKLKDLECRRWCRRFALPAP